MRLGGTSRWALVLGGVAIAVSLSATASAGHCGPSDKDHLDDGGTGQCGYFVQPVPSPLPSSTPTPTPTQPVTVENRPDVRIVQPTEDSPLRVSVENQQQAPTDGWSGTDSQHLADLHRFIVHLGGLIAFCLGGVVVLLLPRMF